MVDVKCIMVLGPGGSRIDFISGWLGILPDFVDSNWHIKPVTGQSKINPNFSKMFDYFPESKLRNELFNYRYNLTPNANLTISLPCHGKHVSTLIDQQDLDSSAVRLINIDVNNSDKHTVMWEFVCKTFLTDQKEFADPTLTEEQIVEKVSNHFRTFRVGSKSIPNALELKYENLFVPGGSYYLAQALGINVDQHYHNYYDTMLILSKTPDEFVRYGKLWRKQDFPYNRK